MTATTGDDTMRMSAEDRRRKIASMLAQGAIAVSRTKDDDEDRPENYGSQQPADNDQIAQSP